MKTSPCPTGRTSAACPKRGKSSRAGFAASVIRATASGCGMRCRMSPFAVPAINGPIRSAETSPVITSMAPFLSETSRGKGSNSPMARSSRANSSPMSRQPRSPSCAASVDLPDPDSPVITRARPSFSTLDAWSSRCRRQPSAICRFMPISAANSPCVKLIGAASARPWSPVMKIDGLTHRRTMLVGSSRTVKSATLSFG